MSTPTSLQLGLYLREKPLVARFQRFAAESRRSKSDAARILIEAGLAAFEHAAAATDTPMDDADAARPYIGGKPYRTLLTPKGKAGR